MKNKNLFITFLLFSILFGIDSIAADEMDYSFKIDKGLSYQTYYYNQTPYRQLLSDYGKTKGMPTQTSSPYLSLSSGFQPITLTYHFVFDYYLGSGMTNTFATGDEFGLSVNLCTTSQAYLPIPNNNNVNTLDYIHNTNETCNFMLTTDSGRTRIVDGVGSIYQYFYKIKNTTILSVATEIDNTDDSYGVFYEPCNDGSSNFCKSTKVNWYRVLAVVDFNISNGTNDTINFAISDATLNTNSVYNNNLYIVQTEDGERTEEDPETIWEAITQFPSRFANAIKIQLTNISDGIINGIKNLFVPSDMSFMTDFEETITTKLGFIAEIPIRIINFAIDLASSSWDSFTSLTLPTINIFGYNFWESQEIDLTEAINIFRPYRYVTDVVCVVICVNTLNKWRETIFGGGN